MGAAHSSANAMDRSSISAPLTMLVAANSPASLAVGWSLMTLAMMLPVLIGPLGYILRTTFAHRRGRSVALFLVGYFMLWTAAGPVLLAIGTALRLPTPQSWLPATTVLGATLLWQFSPWKQRCLNRCHVHMGLSAFGLSADLSALRFGLIHGIWCVGSCWALMLFPLLLPHGHLLAMMLISGLMSAERIESPARPRWEVRGLGKLMRIIVVQASLLSA
jgi:predicted metal-binding membrane protein